MRRCTSTDADGVIGRNVDKRDLDRLPTRYTILVGAIIVRRCEYTFVNFVANADVRQNAVTNVDPDIFDIFPVAELDCCAAFAIYYSGIQYDADSIFATS